MSLPPGKFFIHMILLDPGRMCHAEAVAFQHLILCDLLCPLILVTYPNNYLLYLPYPRPRQSLKNLFLFRDLYVGCISVACGVCCSTRWDYMVGELPRYLASMFGPPHPWYLASWRASDHSGSVSVPWLCLMSVSLFGRWWFLFFFFLVEPACAFATYCYATG